MKNDDAPYDPDHLTGFTLPLTRGDQEFTSLWFNKFDEARKVLPAILAQGWEVNLEKINAKQCTVTDGGFEWADKPEWTGKVREAISKEISR